MQRPFVFMKQFGKKWKFGNNWVLRGNFNMQNSVNWTKKKIERFFFSELKEKIS